MPKSKYFKKDAGDGVVLFYAYHGNLMEGLSEILKGDFYPIFEEAGFYGRNSSAPFYEVTCSGRAVMKNLTPCTREEFEGAKAAALAAIAALMDEQLQAA